MKAAIYNGKEDISVVDLETPVCGDNDIVIKNIYSSICGTDVAVFRHGPATGHKVTVGGEFGHETISEVVAVGKRVQGIEAGQRVYPYPSLAKGDRNRAGTLGGFSEYILVPNAELNKQAYAVSDKISSKVGCLIEPFTIGNRAARRAMPQKGENAIVFGAGTIGIAVSIALKQFGCNKVMVTDVSDFRLEKIKELGFETCNSSKEDLKEKAMGVFGTAPGLQGQTANADIYVDAAGVPSVLEIYQDMGKIFSRIVVVAVLAGKRPVDILSMTYAQQALIGSGGYMPEDVRDVMVMMESGKYDLESIITHEFALKDISEAIRTAGKVHEALNVVIKF
ncbi:zinc-dependent alcohol dehydrogenase [Lacrimispora sp.]|uniref:zinc-dependent alcohol dehydrogenase n=1 Tax=Lacrimispora sp. TaxID=2719234 RepID=UPI0028A59D50|nr:zinc-binding dehydrogenase [Lacrimispora sp.]